MESVRAMIVDGDRVVADGVMVHYDIRISRGGLKEWFGQFELPGFYSIQPETYRLVAIDGREGEIIASRVSMGSHQNTHVDFVGSGPFEVPA